MSHLAEMVCDKPSSMDEFAERSSRFRTRYAEVDHVISMFGFGEKEGR